jgi:ATP-binding cassette subfamily B protein
MAVPKVLQYFIDKVLPAKDFVLFQWLMAGLAVLIGAMLAMQMIQSLLQRTISEHAAKDMHLSIFRHLRKLGFAYYEQHPVGETLSLFNTEVAAVQRLFNNYFPGMIRNIFFLAISLGLLLSIHAGLSLLILPGFLSYYLVSPHIERKASTLDRESMQVRTETDKKVYDSIVGVTELRAHPVARKWDFDRFMTMQGNASSKQFQQNVYSYLRGSVRQLSVNIGLITVFAFGIVLVREQSITVGQFVAFALYYSTVTFQMTRIVTNMTEQRMLMFQALRIYEFMKQTPAITEVEAPVEPARIRGAIAFRHVKFGYTPERPTINDFHIEIVPGERIAVVGTSGNGKSTIVKLLGRFYDPTDGDILLDGTSISRMSLSRLRDAIGFVFQETYLFGSSVRENIRFGNPEATDEEVVQAAKTAFAHDFIMELPQGYDTPVGERGNKLSGGQKQRLAIARMIVKNPVIIVLDEATSALDSISEKEVLEALGKLTEGRTTIAIAHRLSTIRDYDRIVVLEEGAIREIGDYETLMENKGPFYWLAAGKEGP